MEFVNRSLSVKESALVEEVVTRIALVGHNGFDFGVSERSKLNIKGGISSLEAECSAVGSSCQCKELRQGDFHGSVQENLGIDLGKRVQ